jgi:hypothetical protein
LSGIWPQLPLLLQLDRGTRVRLGYHDLPGSIRVYQLRVGQTPISALVKNVEIEEPPPRVERLIQPRLAFPPPDAS